MNGLPAFGEAADARDPRDCITGVVVGVVRNNKDPEERGRVQVWFPRISNSGASHWARVASPMAGPDCGLFLIPAIDDEVLVAFEHGMLDRPVVLGALWNLDDRPPREGAQHIPDVQVLKSRSGHTIMLDDSAGAEKIEIRDRSSTCTIVIDSQQKSITLTPGSGGHVNIGDAAAAKTLALHEEVVDMLSDIELMFTTLTAAWAALPCAGLFPIEGPALKAVWSGAVQTTLQSLSLKLKTLQGSAKGRSS